MANLRLVTPIPVILTLPPESVPKAALNRFFSSLNADMYLPSGVMSEFLFSKLKRGILAWLKRRNLQEKSAKRSNLPYEGAILDKCAAKKK